MEQYDELFETIERLTGKVLLQGEMDEIVRACRPLDVRKELVMCQNSAARMVADCDHKKAKIAALSAENAKLRAVFGKHKERFVYADAIESEVELWGEDLKEIIAVLDSKSSNPLYSAAPEMLEALKIVSDTGGSLKNAELFRVRDIIKKAQGKYNPADLDDF